MISKKSLLITSLGNVLEWFDFGLFIFLAPMLGEKFFPIHDAKAATLAAFTVFAAGYICRPIGGILFGHFGDTEGRANPLRYSILIMTLSTFCIGLLPSYASWGFTATLLFAFLRLLQGISVGGEYSGIMIYLAETSPLERRGFFTSFAGVGSTLGVLLATITCLLLKNLMPVTLLNTWGWRLPFLLMGCIGSIIFYYRFKLKETPTFHYLKSHQTLDQKPLWDAIRFSPMSIFRVLGLTCLSASFYIIFIAYMPKYLSETAKLSLNLALIFQCIALVMSMICIPLFATLGDHVGRKNMLMLTSLTIFIFVVPCFYLINQNHLPLILITLGFAALLSSADQGNNLAAFVENCPPTIRYSVIAFAYNIGNAIFGGAGPLIATLLVNHINIYGPAYFLMVTASITFLTVLTLMDKQETLQTAVI